MLNYKDDNKIIIFFLISTGFLCIRFPSYIQISGKKT